MNYFFELQKKIKRGVENPYKFFSFLARHNFLNWLPDKMYISLIYRSQFGKKLDWNNPKTFNEKLQWLKLYDRNPIYTTMVDKYEVKRFISDRIGEEYVIPTYGVWDSFDDVDFDKLPDKFVLKCTHDSGSIVICTDKEAFDFQTAKKRLNKGLRTNYYKQSREWPYKNVKPRIIAEKYIEDSKTNELCDYKFFCFNGEPKLMYLSNDNAVLPYTDFFDMDFKHLPIRMHDPNSEVLPDKPEMFELMKQLAGVLAEGVPELRVDFYQVDSNVYIGELTFFHCGGFVKIHPYEWAEKLGDWIELPNM